VIADMPRDMDFCCNRPTAVIAAALQIRSYEPN